MIFSENRCPLFGIVLERYGRQRLRKLIAFDEDTFDKLKQLARDRMATIQELADEAFADPRSGRRDVCTRLQMLFR